MTPLALIGLAERLEEAADYLSADDAKAANVLRLAAEVVRRQVAREWDWPVG